MSAESDNNKGQVEGAYEIELIEPTDTPPDMEGGGWHRYVIGLGETRISGFQRGSLDEVTQSVQETVARLNERRLGKRGRVHLDMTAKGKKTAGT